MAMPRVAVQKAGLRANPQMVPRSRGFLERIETAAFRLGHESQRKCQQKARHCRHVKGKAPAVHRTQLASQQIPGGGAHRDRQVEDAQNAAAFLLREKIGDKRGSDGHEGGLANSHQGVAQQ